LKTEIDADQDLKHDFHVLLWIDPDLLSQNSENFKSLPFKQCFGSGSGLDLDPDPIGIQPKMLDPDPYQMNMDPKHCFLGTFSMHWLSLTF
jgi:hypothetical protein